VQSGVPARPVAGSGPQADVEALAHEIDHPRAGFQTHGDLGMGELKTAQPRRQPLGGQGLQGADRQHALAGLGQVGNRRAQQVYRLARRPGQPLARRRQHHLSRQPAEQGLIQPALQRLHLPADRGLGDPQFVGRLGEAFQACGRLEDPDGAERHGGEAV
jgi:hypothetical protein